MNNNSGLFNNGGSVLTADNSKPFIALKIGEDGQLNSYALIRQASLEQNFRTSYNIALDGTLYVLDAGRGYGTYNFTVFDGPYLSCGNNNTSEKTLLSTYLSMSSLDSRIVTLILNNKETFKGVLDSIRVDTTDKPGIPINTITLTVIGDWV